MTPWGGRPPRVLSAPFVGRFFYSLYSAVTSDALSARLNMRTLSKTASLVFVVYMLSPMIQLVFVVEKLESFVHAAFVAVPTFAPLTYTSMFGCENTNATWFHALLVIAVEATFAAMSVLVFPAL